MTIHVTARHFKAHESLIDYVERSVEELGGVYDGIVRADIILSFEKARNSVKICEIGLKVHGTTITSKGRTEDFFKSIDEAIGKGLIQLKRYKDKLHKKNRLVAQKIRVKEE